MFSKAKKDKIGGVFWTRGDLYVMDLRGNSSNNQYIVIFSQG